MATIDPHPGEHYNDAVDRTAADDRDRFDREQFDRDQQNLIDRYGWSVIGVFPTADEPDAQFAYTVGLTEHGHPEFMIFGLPPQTAHQLLNDMATRVFDRAARFTHGQHITDLIRDHVAVVVNGTPPEAWPPGVAYGRYGADAVAVQQIVWPDEAGRYPWDAGWSFPPDAQPVIGTPETAAAPRFGTDERFYDDNGWTEALGRLDNTRVAVDATVREWILQTYRQDGTDEHLRACPDTTVNTTGGHDGFYECDTGCEYLRLVAVVSCPHHGTGDTYEYGKFGNLVDMIKAIEQMEQP
jgi:hypothetical protein